MPRASKLGSLFLCDQRQVFDRMVDEGSMTAPEDMESDYAKLGTCIHYLMQKEVNSQFPNGEEAPSPEDWEGAQRLVGTDAVNHCTRVAHVAAVELLQIGRHWLAETAWEMPHMSGHIDFISQDGDVIVDLKTTQRVPDHQRMKPAHLYQLVAYWLLSGRKAKRGYVLYVDAKNAEWTLMCPFRFDTEAINALADYVVRYLGYLTGPTLASTAVPRLGSHCVSEYCPYRDRCRDYYLPPAGLLSGRTSSRGKRDVPPVHIPVSSERF